MSTSEEQQQQQNPPPPPTAAPVDQQVASTSPTTPAVAENKTATSSKNTKKDDGSDKKKKKGTDLPSAIVLAMIIYYIGVNILLGIASKLFDGDEEAISSFENLYTSEGSAPRSLLNFFQFTSRSTLVLVGLLIGTFILIFGLIISFGGVGLYLTLSAPLAEYEYLIKKPLILVLPLIGMPIGYFYLWPGINSETGEKNVPSLFGFLTIEDATTYGYMMTLILFAINVSLYKLGEQEQKRQEIEKKKKEKEKQSLADKVLSETKIGEMSVEGEKVKDISAKDAFNFVKTAAQTKEERLAEILKEEENLYYKAARFTFGILYGFFLGFMFEVAKVMFWPPLEAMFFGGDSFMLTFLWEGFRKANALNEKK